MSTPAAPPSSAPSWSLASRSLREQLSRRLNESASAPTSTFAQTQLQQMGWTPGTGLGKHRTGRTTHLTVQPRPEGVGLGMEQVARQEQQVAETWWKETMGDTLARLSAASSKSKKKKSKNENEDSKKRRRRTIKTDYTDEELFQATGGARFGMRAAPTKNLAKWRRTHDTVIQDTIANHHETHQNDNDAGKAASNSPCVQQETKLWTTAIKVVSDADDAEPAKSQEPDKKRKRKEKKDKKRKKEQTKLKKDKKKKITTQEKGDT